MDTSALHEASGHFHRTLAVAALPPSRGLDLFVAAATAVETGIREGDQPTLDAGARLLNAAADAIAEQR